MIYSIATISKSKTVDWGHPVVEHKKGIVTIKKTGNEAATENKATIIEKDNEI